MNKKEFLEKLEKSLQILNEDEREDILEEYRNTIEEKVKNGQTEEEAVSDFGDIDNLVKDILSAYKINPDYNKKNNFDKIVDTSEHFIKKTADKLANYTKDAAKNFKDTREINLSLVFEIVIKIIFTVILINILKLPFMWLKNIGHDGFGDFLGPIDDLVYVVWVIFLFVIYIGICALIIIAMFKEYFKNSNKDQNNSPKEERVETPNIEEVKEEKKTINNEPKANTLGNILMLIVKIWVIIFIIIPFIFIDLAILACLILSIIYFIKGIDLIGLSLLLAGIFTLFTWIIKLIYNLITKKSHNSIIPFFSSLVLIIAGGFLFVEMIFNIDYKDEIPDNIKLNEQTSTYTTDKEVYINYSGYDYITKQIDETIEDNTFKIKVSYSEDLYDINIKQTNNYQFDNTNNLYNYISITDHRNYSFENTKKLYNSFIENLKDNEIYNYSKLYYPTIEVIANTKTMAMITIN